MLQKKDLGPRFAQPIGTHTETVDHHLHGMQKVQRGAWQPHFGLIIFASSFAFDWATLVPGAPREACAIMQIAYDFEYIAAR